MSFVAETVEIQGDKPGGISGVLQVIISNIREEL